MMGVTQQQAGMMAGKLWHHIFIYLQGAGRAIWIYEHPKPRIPLYIAGWLDSEKGASCRIELSGAMHWSCSESSGKGLGTDGPKQRKILFYLLPKTGLKTCTLPTGMLIAGPMAAAGPLLSWRWGQLVRDGTTELEGAPRIWVGRMLCWDLTCRHPPVQDKPYVLPLEVPQLPELQMVSSTQYVTTQLDFI